MKSYWDLSRGELLGAVLMVVLLGVPISAGAQATAADQPTGKLVITGSSTGSRSAAPAVHWRSHRAELEQFSAFFKLKPEDIKADLIAAENQQGIKLVAGNPDALVYMSIGALRVRRG